MEEADTLMRQAQATLQLERLPNHLARLALKRLGE